MPALRLTVRRRWSAHPKPIRVDLDLGGGENKAVGERASKAEAEFEAGAEAEAEDAPALDLDVALDGLSRQRDRHLDLFVCLPP